MKNVLILLLSATSLASATDIYRGIKAGDGETTWPNPLVFSPTGQFYGIGVNDRTIYGFSRIAVCFHNNRTGLTDLGWSGESYINCNSQLAQDGGFRILTTNGSDAQGPKVLVKLADGREVSGTYIGSRKDDLGTSDSVVIAVQKKGRGLFARTITTYERIPLAKIADILPPKGALKESIRPTRGGSIDAPIDIDATSEQRAAERNGDNWPPTCDTNTHPKDL